MRIERDELRKCEDALFRMAALKLESDEAKRLLHEIERGETEFSNEALEQAYRSSLPRFRATLDRLEKDKRRRFWKGAFPRIAQVACAVLLVGYIGSTVAFATSASFRVALMNFVIKTQKEFTSLSLEPTGETIDVPAEWTGQYFPAYIPEGYEVTQVDCLQKEGEVVFADAEDRMIFYSEYSSASAANLDTENAEERYVEVRGTPATMWQKNNRTFLVWAWFDRYFILRVDGDAEAALKIAESVEKIF